MIPFRSIFLGLLFLGPAVVLAATPAPSPDLPLVIATKPVEPFAFKKNGRLTGFSVELWEEIARRGNIRYEFLELESVPQVLDALEKGRADVGVAALSITSEREKIIDFSHPFYRSGLQILVGESDKVSALALVRHVLSATIFKATGVLVFLILLTAHLLWFFERRRNPDSFPKEYFAGVVEALWWSVTTLISGGCENKAPIGPLGRLVAIAWMLGGILLVAYVTATLTSSMTVSRLESGIKGPDDLTNHRVGALAGTTSVQYLIHSGALVREYPKLDEAIAGLNSGEVDAVVYDAPMLLYYINRLQPGHDHLVGPLFERQGYGFGLRNNSPHREKINRLLLELQEEGFLIKLNAKWFGSAGEGP